MRSYQGLQTDVVHLGWPIAPSYMSPNTGRRGVAGSQPMSTAVHRSQNKLRKSNSIFNPWVVWFGSLPSASCPSFSVFLCVAGRPYWGGGRGRSQILRPQEWPVSIKETKLFIAHHVVSACRYSKSTNWEMREAKCLRCAEVILGDEGYLTEAEFLYKIQTKFFRVFILAAIHSLLYCTALPWDIYFFQFTQPLTVSRVHYKGERRKTW